MYLITLKTLSNENSVDPGQLSHYVASHLVPVCIGTKNRTPDTDA